MKYLTSLLFTIVCILPAAWCQDTFSIVALDSVTRQVGSAGASCLDLYWAGISDPAFLSDLLPDTGAVNTQSYFIQANQDNARTRMRAGDTPQQIISWLVANDANNNPEFKQYGIVGFIGNSAAAASHTGTSCINYKNHVTGSINGMYYAIQGNILKGQEILDSMESRFRNTNGTLACRLMAAMQGAKVVGADTRCQAENTSSLFAFLKVTLPTDTYGQPVLNISLKTAQGAGIEPIDSLQTLFNAVNGCAPLSSTQVSHNERFRIFPNPAHRQVCIEIPENKFPNANFTMLDLHGREVVQSVIEKSASVIDIAAIPTGIYVYQIFFDKQLIQTGKIHIER